VLASLLSLSLCLLAPPAGADEDAARQAMSEGSYRSAASMLGAEAGRAGDDPVRGPHLRYLQGRALQLAGDHRGAVRAFEQLIDDFPDSAWVRKARFCIADSRAELGDTADAAIAYREGTDELLDRARRDEIAAIFRQYAHAAFAPDEDKAAPDYSTAQALFSTVLALEPSDELRHDAEHHRAICQLELGDVDGAATTLAARLDEDDDPLAAEDRYQLARARAPRDAEDALRQYHLVVRLHPEHARAGDALWEAALLLAPEGARDALDPERAVSDLRQLHTTYPEHEHAGESHLRIARVLSWAGRRAEAMDAYRDFIDAPDRAAAEARPDAMVELGHLLEGAGDPGSAEAVFRRFAAEYPNHQAWPEIQRHLGSAELREGLDLYRGGDLDGATAAFARHADANPTEDAEARYLAGLARYRQGRLDEAVAEFEAVASKYARLPIGGRAEYALARIALDERRDVELAREHLERCMTLPSPDGGCYTLSGQLDAEGLDLYAERPLRTDEPAQVWMRARNLERVELTLHRIDPEILMRKEGSVAAMDSLDVELIEPDLRWTVDLDDDDDGLEWRGPVALKERRAGVYVVGATGETIRAQVPVVITDITAAVHRHLGDLVVYVQHRSTGMPVAGARILISDGVTLIAEGQTDRTGIFRRAGPPEGDPLPHHCTVLALKGRSMATANADGPVDDLAEELPLVHYVYTDRPAYRPGGTVSYRAVLRRLADRRLDDMAGTPIRVSLVSPRGWTVASHDAHLDRFGAISGEFSLDADPSARGGSLGTYRVVVALEDGEQGATSFEVTDAPPSRRQLTVEFDRDVYVIGDEASVTLRATTYTGEPIVGARIHYRWDGLGDAGLTDPTDDEGRAMLTAGTLNRGGLRQLTLVAHLDGEPVEVRESAPVRESALDLDLDLDRAVVRAGEAVQLTLRAEVGDQGSAVPIRARLVHLDRPAPPPEDPPNPFAPPLWEESFERSLSPAAAAPEEAVQEVDLATGDGGEVAHSWVLSAPGRYQVVVSARDDRDRAVRARAEVVAVGDDGPSSGLALLPERSTLSAGEPARLALLGAGPGPVLLMVQADGVASSRVVQLSGPDDVVQLPLDTSLTPRARIAAVAVRDDRVLSGHTDLRIQASLKVEIEGLDGEHTPGAPVPVSLRVRDEAGRPADAQVSVAVVSRSLLAQYPERRRRAEGIFLPSSHELYGFTNPAVRFRAEGYGAAIDAAILAEMERLRARDAGPASALRPDDIDMLAEAEEVYWLEGEQWGSGGLGTTGYGAGGGGYGSGSGSLGVRSSGTSGVGHGGRGRQVDRFRAESALWIADLETGADGEARVLVPLPDHNEAWSVIVVAVDPERRTGDARGELVARGPTAVEVTPPRFVRLGDAPQLTGEVLADAGGSFPVQGAIGSHALGSPDLTLEPARPRPLHLAGPSLGIGDATRLADGTLAVPFVLELGGGGGANRAALAARLALADLSLERWSAGRLDRPVELDLPAPDGLTGDRQLVLELAPATLPGALALALAPSTVCLRAPDTSANLAFAATTLLDGPPGRLSADEEGMIRGLAQHHLAALLGGGSSGGQSWDRPGVGHDGTLTALGYVALVQGLELGLLPVEAETTARDQATRARAQLVQLLRSDGSAPAARQALILYALSAESGDEASWSPALTRLLRSAADPRTRGRLATAAVRFGAREEAAELRADLVADVERALEGQDALSLAPAVEGLAALEPGHPLLDRAIPAIEGQLDRSWLPAYRVAELSAVLARLGGAAGGSTPSAVDVVLPDGSRQRVDLSAGGAPRLTALVPEGTEAVLALEPVGRGSLRYRAGIVGAADGTTTAIPDDPRLGITRHHRRPSIRLQGVDLPQGFSALTGRYEQWSDELVTLPVGRESRVTLEICYARDQATDPEGSVWVLEEMLPGGAAVVPGSVSGGLHAEPRGDRLVAYLDGTRRCSTLTYTLRGQTPGEFGAPGARLRRMDDGTVFEVGPGTRLAISPVPEPASEERVSADVEYPAEPFRATPDELHALGLALAKQERWDGAVDALEQLLTLGTVRSRLAGEVAAQLLHGAVAGGDDQAALRAFELLKEKDPSYPIPFDEIVAVARAYEAAGEPHRALRVYRTTLAARFLTEARMGRVLEGENLLLPSLRFGADLTRAYPDLPAVQGSLFHLPQIWADRAATAEHDPSLRARGIGRDTMLATSADWMLEFAARYPDSPLAEEAAFHLAGTYLELGDHTRAARTARAAARRYPEGGYLDSFLYMEGHAHRAQGRMGAALLLLDRVASGSFVPAGGGAPAASEQRPLALYSIAQIHDAQGRTEEALETYREVSDRFRDAAEAVAQMEAVVLACEEVRTLATNASPALELTVRNVDQADLLLYRVDLMRLYLREKNLSNVTGVRLAGIEPSYQRRLPFGARYREQEIEVPLPLSQPGAYLAVLKGERQSLSSLLLYSDLQLSVQEDRNYGRVRVTVTDPAGRPVPGAHVKVIGTGGGAIVSGDTDLRGVFVAENVHGVPTVIARHLEHYALHRGAQQAPPPPPIPMPSRSQANEVDLLEQLRSLGYVQRQDNRAAFDDQFYGAKVEGVSAEQLE